MSKSLKSLFYGMIKEKYVIELMIGSIAVVFITILVNAIGDDTPLTMFDTFSNPDFGSLMRLVFMIAPLTSILCICRDFDDKTVNYEITGGAKRLEVFLTRYLTAMIIGGITVSLSVFVPMLLGTILCGFGNTSQAGSLIFRYILFVIASLREISFVCFICFIVRKSKLSVVVPGVLYTITLVVSIYLPTKDKTMTAFTNAMEAVNPKIDYIYNISQTGIAENMIFDVNVAPEFVVKTIIMSITLAAVYGLLAWVFFKSDDME